MSPGIREGDELLVDPHRAPRLGNVIVFAQGEMLIAHRVIGTGASLLTAGDASSTVREKVDPRMVLGTVVEIRRRGSIIRSPLRSPIRALILRARLALKYHTRIRR